MTAHIGVARAAAVRGEAITRVQRGAPSAIVCAVLILAVKLALATAGFARTLAWARAAANSPAFTPPPDALRRLAVERIAHAVALAAALYPGRALCLEQSLVLSILLGRAGIDAHLRFGVQVHPFLAHTWVEVAGEPVNDFPEHISHFMVLPDLVT